MSGRKLSKAARHLTHQRLGTDDDMSLRDGDTSRSDDGVCFRLSYLFRGKARRRRESNRFEEMQEMPKSPALAMKDSLARFAERIMAAETRLQQYEGSDATLTQQAVDAKRRQDVPRAMQLLRRRAATRRNIERFNRIVTNMYETQGQLESLEVTQDITNMTRELAQSARQLVGGDGKLLDELHDSFNDFTETLQDIDRYVGTVDAALKTDGAGGAVGDVDLEEELRQLGELSAPTAVTDEGNDAGPRPSLLLPAAPGHQLTAQPTVAQPAAAPQAPARRRVAGKEAS